MVARPLVCQAERCHANAVPGVSLLQVDIEGLPQIVFWDIDFSDRVNRSACADGCFDAVSPILIADSRNGRASLYYCTGSDRFVPRIGRRKFTCQEGDIGLLQKSASSGSIVATQAIRLAYAKHLGRDGGAIAFPWRRRHAIGSLGTAFALGTTPAGGGPVLRGIEDEIDSADVQPHEGLLRTSRLYIDAFAL